MQLHTSISFYRTILVTITYTRSVVLLPVKSYSYISLLSLIVATIMRHDSPTSEELKEFGSERTFKAESLITRNDSHHATRELRPNLVSQKQVTPFARRHCSTLPASTWFLDYILASK